MGINRKLNMGMIGGGPGAFIGEVHRKAARLDGNMQLVAGAFDIDPVKSRQMGEEQNLSPDRAYDDYKKMIDAELKLPEGERIDFVSITTPNNWHFPMAKDFLQAGFHVMCEKPMTMTVTEAKDLQQIVKDTGKVFGLMHTYTGYPMAKLARDMIKQGDLGEIRKIIVQYPQAWLATPLEETGQQQAAWRTDPKQSGAAGCIGDIGTHAANLSEYFSGLRITRLCADITTFVEGRRLDDDGNCLLRYDNGAKGVLHCSQVAIGEENNIAIWVYGTKKGLEWHQEHPNYLYVNGLEGPTQIWKRGNDYVGEKSAAAGRATRLPFGHPEAFLESVANIYNNFGDTIIAQMLDQKPDEIILDFPNVDDGVRGMIFIEKVLENSKSDKKWTSME